MNKNKKSKATGKTKKKIYLRPSGDHGSLSSGSFQLEPKKSGLSGLDVHFDPVNTFLRKRIRDRITLDSKEKKELKPILNQFEESECYKDKEVCNPDTCRFARIPDEWVKYERYVYLCDLVYDYIEYGPSLNPPNGGDAMGGRMPGDGFCNQ